MSNHNPSSPLIGRCKELNTHIRHYTIVLEIMGDVEEASELMDDMQEQLDDMNREAEELAAIINKMAQLTLTSN